MRRAAVAAVLVLLTWVAPGGASGPGHTEAAPATPNHEAISGTWVLQQVSSEADLARLAPTVLGPALATPGVRGFSLRVPWKAIDTDCRLLEAGLALARKHGVAYSVRFMAGRHTPASVFADGCRFYPRRGSNEKVPAPVLADGSPNTVFEKHYAALARRLAAWCRASGVRLLHMAWYGQEWAELNHGKEVRALAGYSYANWLRAHTRLIDIALERAGPDLAVEFPFSGYGPLTEAAGDFADHVVKTIGPWDDRFVFQANGWGPKGDWGAPSAATEAAFDRVWAKPLYRGQQAIQPTDFDWPVLYRNLRSNRSTYGEVYAPSFTKPNRAALAKEILAFREERRRHPRPDAAILVRGSAGDAGAPGARPEQIRPERLRIVPNFQAASVYAFYAGDADADATCRLAYRTGGGEWREGHPLARTGHTKTFPDTGRFAGSIFGLEPDRPLEVRVTLADPDGLAGGAPATLTASARTRSDTFPTGGGRTYYVGPQGNDAGPGTREKPLATVGHAVGLVQPGDTVYLLDGSHAGNVTIKRSGRADAYIRLAAAPATGVPPTPGPARVHLVGWVPAAKSWEDLGKGLFALAEKRRIGAVTMNLPHPTDDDRPVGTRLYHHGSLEELKQAQPPLVPGWWQDEQAGRLYVRKPEGRPVTAYTVRLGVLPFGLKFQGASYWVVEGLAVALFGGGPYSRGIEVREAHDVVIRGCRFDCLRTGVSIGRGSERCLIERCTFRDNAIWEWPWHACKSHDVEGCAVSLSGGSGNVVRHNAIRGWFNGIAPATWGNLENDRLNADMDVHHNRFTHVADDCIEPEGSCMNVRFWNNHAHDVFMGISIAPVTVGPCWVVRDRYEHFKHGGLKVGISSRGVTYVYHTLFWQDNPGKNATGVCGPWDNMHFRNTVFRGTKYAIEDNQPHPLGCTFDHCCLYATRGEPFVKWEGKRYGALSDLPPEKGFGPNNVCAEPYRGVTDGRPADLAPEMIDAGVRLPGINDAFTGKAPDVGPEEVK